MSRQFLNGSKEFLNQRPVLYATGEVRFRNLE
jgi:hypothetical protein